MLAIADERPRILLTLATGTGKTFIAFQIAWKLFHARWNLSRQPTRRPRILFLADRNILANQAFNAFSAFPEDALVRIEPEDIRKKSRVPKNGSLFFTIFQTFMSGPPKDGKPSPYFGEYPPDFFDFIIIDECHRGGANDEGNWRGILEYFAPAVQLGLTATPKRKDNVDTYRYFGEPVFVYSLKEGINDGFLTPFRVKQIQTTLDYYLYTSDDTVEEGEIEEGKVYEEADFNRTIEIRERERKRVEIFMGMIQSNQKTLVFCANQNHALLVRDLINQLKRNKHPGYCQRVTADDGALGEEWLRDFQDNDKTVPTILTTSQKLSTGVDARNIRNIVLMRPIPDRSCWKDWRSADLEPINSTKCSGSSMRKKAISSMCWRTWPMRCHRSRGKRGRAKRSPTSTRRSQPNSKPSSISCWRITSVKAWRNWSDPSSVRCSG